MTSPASAKKWTACWMKMQINGVAPATGHGIG